MGSGRYEASGTSLFGGVGGPMAPRYLIDGPGVAEAIAGSATGLIHQAYQRKLSQRQQQREDERLKLEQTRVADERTYHEHSLDRQAERDRLTALQNGVVRGTPAKPAGYSATPSEGSLIASALNPETAVPMPTFTPPVAATPDHYDPERDSRRIRVLDAIGARGTEQRKTEDVRQQGRVDRDAARHTFKLEEQADKAARDAERSAAHDNRVTARGTGPGGGRALSANGKEVAKKTLLDGLVGYHGDEAKVRAYLTEDDVGKASAEKYGVTDADITAALGRATTHKVDQTVRIVGSGRKPEKAAAAVRGAREAVVNGGKPPAAAAAPGATVPTAPAAAAAAAPPPANQLPPLSKAERDRAAADPDYKAFKIAKGYTF